MAMGKPCQQHLSRVNCHSANSDQVPPCTKPSCAWLQFLTMTNLPRLLDKLPHLSLVSPCFAPNLLPVHISQPETQLLVSSLRKWSTIVSH